MATIRRQQAHRYLSPAGAASDPTVAKSSPVILSCASRIMRPHSVPFGQTISSPCRATTMPRVMSEPAGASICPADCPADFPAAGGAGKPAADRRRPLRRGGACRSKRVSHASAASAKSGQRVLALRLGFVAVDRRRIDAGLRQMPHDLVGAMLGPSEYQDAFEIPVMQ